MEVKPLPGTSCYPWLFWNLSVLTLGSHSQRCLDKIIGAGGKWSFNPLEKGLNQGLMGSAASHPQIPALTLRGSWDTGTADIKGAVNGLCPGYLQLPTAPQGSQSLIKLCTAFLPHHTS